MKYLSFLALLPLLLSQAAYANNDGHDKLREIQEMNPNASKHEVLALFYEQSNEPASVMDFPLNTDVTSNHQCRMPSTKNGEIQDNKLFKIYINRIDTPGLDNGPLFDAPSVKIFLSTTDRGHIKMVYDRVEGGTPSRFKNRYNATVMEQNSYELIATAYENRTTSIRKYGNLTSFKHTTFESNDGPLFDRQVLSVRYGYCWGE
ncbi:MAG: hypothetical protein WD512_16695 [Candidatus Paceibacterota bacterium]